MEFAAQCTIRHDFKLFSQLQAERKMNFKLHASPEFLAFGPVEKIALVVLLCPSKLGSN